MNRSGSSPRVRVMSPRAWLPPFLQVALGLGRILSIRPRLAIASHSSLPGTRTGRPSPGRRSCRPRRRRQPVHHGPHAGDVCGVPVGDMAVRDGPGGYVYDAVQLDPSALGLGPVMPDAEPPGEPVAGVADSTTPCQRAGRDVAHDPQVHLAQVRFGYPPVGAPDGVPGWYPGQSDPADHIRMHLEVANHLP